MGLLKQVNCTARIGLDLIVAAGGSLEIQRTLHFLFFFFFFFTSGFVYETVD